MLLISDIVAYRDLADRVLGLWQGVGAPCAVACLALSVGVFVASGVFGQSGDGPLRNRPGLSLRETFDLYVRAVQRSDLGGLFSTVTDDDQLLFLTAGGKLIDSRQGYYEFHESWFKETDWTMPVELLEVNEGKEYGFTTALFHYRSRIPDGTMYNLDSYFTLVFRREHGMWKVVADICTPIGRWHSEADSDLRYDADQRYLFDVVKDRRTVRKFKPALIPDEHITKILDAARYAPTAGNQQPWKFLVIRDRSKLDKLRDEALAWYLESHAGSRHPDEEDYQSTREAVARALEDVLSAPVYIAVLVDSAAKYSEYVMQDGVLAAGNLMIAAKALGYGTGFFTTFFPEKEMKAFFEIPDRFRLICFTPIGVPEAWPETPAKKDLQDMVVFESFREVED